jgi:hypothetical protein
MDVGLYANLFEVNFEDHDVDFMHTDRSPYPKLRDLRQQLAERKIEARVFATGGEVYGYGSEQNQLVEFGFRLKSVRIGQIPPLASRLVLEGYANSLTQASYTIRWSFGRATAYQFGKALLETPSGVKLFRGFELQSLYLLNPETNALVYGIVVNAVFTCRDRDDQSLSTREVVARFGHDTLRLLRTRQGDLAPRGGINLEISRQRLVELVLPFVNARCSFVLPCGIPAELNRVPVRIILAGEEQKQ